MNAVLRLVSSTNDMDIIQRYHGQLKSAIEKFEVHFIYLSALNTLADQFYQIQSHINACRLLNQILEKQDRLSDQIQRKGDIKNIVLKSNAVEAYSQGDKRDDHQTKPIQHAYLVDVERKGTTATVSLEVETVECMTRSTETKKTTEITVEKTTPKSAQRTGDPDTQVDNFSGSGNQSDEDDELLSIINPPSRSSSKSNLSSSAPRNRAQRTEDFDPRLYDFSEDEYQSDDDEEEDEEEEEDDGDKVPPTMNTSRRSSSKPNLSSSAPRKPTHKNHATPSPSPCPFFSFTNSGGGVTINRGIGNITNSNISNIGNNRSKNYYHY